MLAVLEIESMDWSLWKAVLYDGGRDQGRNPGEMEGGKAG